MKPNSQLPPPESRQSRIAIAKRKLSVRVIECRRRTFPPGACASDFRVPAPTLLAFYSAHLHPIVSRLSITKTLERYQRCTFTPQTIHPNDHETLNWYQELSKLKAKYESLQRSQRHLLGEDLDMLSLKELQQLERQLESSQSQARQKRTQIMMDQMEELKKKERHLGDINKQLKHKLGTDGGSMRAFQGSWRPDAGASTDSFRNHSSNIDTEPTLQIGRYHQYVPSEATIPRNGGVGNSFMPGWGV